MMKIFRTTVWIALLCLGGQAMAADGIRQLQRFVDTTRTAEGTFEQTVISDGGTPAIQSGTFAFARPGKFRWIYQIPYEQWLVGDGDRLWIWDIDLNQVTVKRIGDALGATPAAVLFGTGELDDDFTLTDEGSRAGLDWVRAVPKRPDTSFESLRLGLANGELKRIEMRDNFGQQSFIVFTRLSPNPVLDEALFRFDVPVRADVIGDE